jgi:hypothetical protein
MRRSAKYLQHAIAQSFGIPLTGFRGLDYPLCERFIGEVAAINTSKRYQGHFKCKAHDPERKVSVA